MYGECAKRFPQTFVDADLSRTSYQPATSLTRLPVERFIPAFDGGGGFRSSPRRFLRRSFTGTARSEPFMRCGDVGFALVFLLSPMPEHNQHSSRLQVHSRSAFHHTDD